MATDLLREHAARCRALVDGASPTLAATFLQLARDLESQADAHERTRGGLRGHAALRLVGGQG